MSWRDDLTDEQRAQMGDIQASLSHTRVASSGTRYFRCEGGKVVEKDRPSAVVAHSMFPYPATCFPSVDMHDPEMVESAVAQCRLQGVTPEFDSEGRFIVTSTKQHDALAKALGMKTGRDGYGHVDEHGKFQNSGRRRNDEIQEGRARVRKARETLESMPETVPMQAVDAVLDEYDIGPTEDNTG